VISRGFAPKSTNHALYLALYRAEYERVIRNLDPSAAIIGSPSVKTVTNTSDERGDDRTILRARLISRL
jgi:hypothetical protein